MERRVEGPAEPLTSEDPKGPYSAKQRLINIVGLSVFAGLTLYAAVRIADAARGVTGLELGPLSLGAGVTSVGLVALGLVAAIPVADFLSGLVHWAADNWGSEDWPVVGGFIGPFRHHHVEPQAMVHHGFLERFGDNVIASMPLFLGGACVDGGPAWMVFASTFWLAAAYWILATAQFHAWAHADDPPRIARRLQRLGLILSPEHHQHHHNPPHNSHYCITTGWCEPVLRWIRFFRALELLITAITGETPVHRKSASS
jgi:Lipid desaturase domain